MSDSTNKSGEEILAGGRLGTEPEAAGTDVAAAPAKAAGSTDAGNPGDTVVPADRSNPGNAAGATGQAERSGAAARSAPGMADGGTEQPVTPVQGHEGNTSPGQADSGRTQARPAGKSAPQHGRAAAARQGGRGGLSGHLPGHLGGNPAPGSLGSLLGGPLIRCGFIGVITLLLLIPLSMVSGLVQERSSLYHDATQSIAGSWGREQTISGPLLIIPYQVWTERVERIKIEVDVDDKGRYKEKYEDVVKRDYHNRFKVVLPSDLHFDTVLNPEVRYRGIYKQALYLAPIDIRGVFDLPKDADFAENLEKVHWDQAWISFGVTGLTSIAETSRLNWGGQEVSSMKPGTNAGDLLGNGFHCPLSLSGDDQGGRRDFAMNLQVRGSGGIYFTPVGERTLVTMKGNWPAPSFQGSLLPTRRNIVDQGENKGFTAEWVISNLTRTYPQIGDITDKSFYRNSQSAITGFVAGMELLEPVSLYRMVGRSVDYGILFITVSFVALFAFELICGQRMHLLQYGMVGLSMSLFYLVLLSVSEHAGFIAAFAGASAVTVLMNSLYLGAVMRSKLKGLLMGALLTALYAVLYSLLNMEDFSLLVGTALVLVMMGALMFVTRNLPQGGSREAS